MWVLRVNALTISGKIHCPPQGSKNQASCLTLGSGDCPPLPFYVEQKAHSTQDGQHPRLLDLATDRSEAEQVWYCWGHAGYGLEGYLTTFIGFSSWLLGDKQGVNKSTQASFFLEQIISRVL